MSFEVYAAIGQIWVVLSTLCFTVCVMYLAYVGFRVVVRHEAQVVTVKILPVTWGSRENQRQVNINV